MEIKYDIQNFTNIDNEKFIGKWGGVEYPVEAGETRPFLSFLVKAFAKQLVDKILLKRKVGDYTNPVKREPLEKQIIGEVLIGKAEEKKKTIGEEVKEINEKATKEFEDLERLKQEEIKNKRVEALKKAREAKKAKAEAKVE